MNGNNHKLFPSIDISVLELNYAAHQIIQTTKTDH